MRVKVTDTLELLERDLREIAARAPAELRAVVAEGIRTGNTVAKDYAKATSGRHAADYPGTFSARMSRSYRAFGVTVHSGEYGPESRGQGNLATILERGSRNNKPHLNLARSADLIGPAFAGEVRRLADGWFW